MTFELQADPPAIKCLICGNLSRNKQDIVQRYCGFCHHWHLCPCGAPGEWRVRNHNWPYESLGLFCALCAMAVPGDIEELGL